MSALAAVQTAIYGALSADTTLAGLSLTASTPTVGVFNDVPDGQGYPHVLVSRPTETPKHTFGGPTRGLGWKDIIRIHVYSRYQGDKEALDIHTRIVALLNFQPLTVAGYSEVSVECESGRVLVEAIEKLETRHVIGEFCVTVKQ